MKNFLKLSLVVFLFHNLLACTPQSLPDVQEKTQEKAALLITPSTGDDESIEPDNEKD